MSIHTLFTCDKELIKKGGKVGLGTDGYINNFFEVMRGAFLIHKADRKDPQIMT